ncbi:TPA: DUF2322 family protein [Neisseria meningitidis]
MNFQDYLATFPSIDHLGGLDVQDADGKTVHHIPAVQGKLGSLKLYNALAERFDGKLDKEAAEQGLIWFAEHVADARVHPGKHPNIDLLEKVVQSGETLLLKPLAAQ